MKTAKTLSYAVETRHGSILCTNGEFYKPMFVGPGGYCARTWRTFQGADKIAARIGGKVIQLHSDHGKTLKPRQGYTATHGKTITPHFDTSKSCVNCIHWQGRTDLNKCKVHPDTLPDWAIGCKDFKSNQETK